MLCGNWQLEAELRWLVFSNRRGFKIAHLVIHHGVAHLDGATAHFAVFDVGLGDRSIQHHRYAFTAIWAGEEVLHAARIAVYRCILAESLGFLLSEVESAADGEGLKKLPFLNL